MFGLFSNGKIEIRLDRYEFSRGENVVGKLVLKMKKGVEARKLEVGLIARKKTVSVDSEGRRRYRWIKIFDFKKPLKGKGVYSGESEYYFKLRIPKDVSSNVGVLLEVLLKDYKCYLDRLQVLSGLLWVI